MYTFSFLKLILFLFFSPLTPCLSPSFSHIVNNPHTCPAQWVAFSEYSFWNQDMTYGCWKTPKKKQSKNCLKVQCLQLTSKTNFYLWRGVFHKVVICWSMAACIRFVLVLVLHVLLTMHTACLMKVLAEFLWACLVPEHGVKDCWSEGLVSNLQIVVAGLKSR